MGLGFAPKLADLVPTMFLPGEDCPKNRLCGQLTDRSRQVAHQIDDYGGGAEACEDSLESTRDKQKGEVEQA